MHWCDTKIRRGKDLETNTLNPKEEKEENEETKSVVLVLYVRHI